MSDVWVVNASPIIALAKVAHLHLLSHLADLTTVEQALKAVGERWEP